MTGAAEAGTRFAMACTLLVYSFALLLVCSSVRLIRASVHGHHSAAGVMTDLA